MEIRTIDNLAKNVKSLSDIEVKQVAELIRQNIQDVNHGEYTPAELERLHAFATPKKIQEEIVKMDFNHQMAGEDLILKAR